MQYQMNLLPFVNIAFKEIRDVISLIAVYIFIMLC